MFSAETFSAGPPPRTRRPGVAPRGSARSAGSGKRRSPEPVPPEPDPAEPGAGGPEPSGPEPSGLAASGLTASGLEAPAPQPANLAADGLTSFAFAVEAESGHRPVRYLIARRLGAGTARTCLVVTAPGPLAGTYLWIAEDAARGTCEVWTRSATMPRSVRIAERQLFGCLPLAEVGYLDIMTWRYPGLGASPQDRRAELPWSRWRSAETRSYLGPATTPGLRVTEATDPATGRVVAREVDRRGATERRWEIVEPGGPGPDAGLPVRIRAHRGDTGATTEYRRDGGPVPVPPEAFDGGPEPLRHALRRFLPARAG
ncbi:hypothetical protein ACGFJT_19555 [Actinomadura geliboluensis]|uniref:hypothetical protein n=1 Tax=Actinomadura geliboluensis TaxID=882440 RepID=UPI00372328A8